jgi:hypothetical protein
MVHQVLLVVVQVHLVKEIMAVVEHGHLFLLVVAEEEKEVLDKIIQVIVEEMVEMVQVYL